MSARIICFDGPDAVGKGTQLELAKQALEAAGKRVYATRTPGGTPIGEELRKVILSHLERPPRADLHVYWAINIALGEDIKAKAADYDYILIDRGPLSFVAYQVFGSGVSREEGLATAKDIMAQWQPDMLLYLEAPVEVTRQRQLKQGKQLDYFESKDDDFHAKVLQGYQEGAKLFDITRVDASRDIEAVHATVMGIINAI